MYFLVDCGGVEFLRIVKFLLYLLDIIFFIAPMILIVMLTIDFGKAVISGSEDVMKKAKNLAIRRVIMCMALFLVTVIVYIAINLLNKVPNYEYCMNKAKGDLSNFPSASDIVENKSSNNGISNKNSGTSSKSSGTSKSTKSKESSTEKHNFLIVGNSKTYRIPKSKTRVSIIFTKMLKNEGIISSSKLKKKSIESKGNLNRNDEVTIITKDAKTLNYLASTKKYSKYMSDRKYDIVILQEQTGVARGDYDTYVKGTNKIASLLKNNNADIYVRTQWPGTNEGRSTLKKFNNNAEKVSKKLSSKGFTSKVVYDGKALMDARGSYSVYDSSDGYHPSNYGAYLSAACTYKTVFGKKASKLKYSKSIYNDDYGISKSDFKKLNKIVDENC